MPDSEDVSGQDALARTLDSLGSSGLHALGGALYRLALAVMADSQEHHVPVDTGVLKASGFVELPVISLLDASVTLGYGGAAKDYATVVHEDPIPQANRDRDRAAGIPRVGNWKYLETPLMAALADMPAALAKEILVTWVKK